MNTTINKTQGMFSPDMAGNMGGITGSILNNDFDYPPYITAIHLAISIIAKLDKAQQDRLRIAVTYEGIPPNTSSREAIFFYTVEHGYEYIFSAKHRAGQVYHINAEAIHDAATRLAIIKDLPLTSATPAQTGSASKSI